MMDTNRKRASDHGLPDYFDMQADLGHTKHLGGWFATQELVALCHLEPGQELLYVGSGAGNSAVKIAQEYECRVVGVDLLEKMVLAAREKAIQKDVADRVEFRVGDARDLPFDDDRFDLLICESVNTFIPNLDRAAGEYVRVIKPGGYVGLNEAIWIKPPPESGDETMRALTGQRLRTSDEWVDMMERAGLQDLVARTANFEMRRESRSQFELIGVGDYARILARFVRILLFDSSIRNQLKVALSEPRSMYAYMGYGLYVGRKPEGFP
jgi:ubiquinone/menaquinone biosynthesis C-methylase UbiE